MIPKPHQLPPEAELHKMCVHAVSVLMPGQPNIQDTEEYAEARLAVWKALPKWDPARAAASTFITLVSQRAVRRYWIKPGNNVSVVPTSSLCGYDQAETCDGLRQVEVCDELDHIVGTVALSRKERLSLESEALNGSFRCRAVSKLKSAVEERNLAEV